MTAQVMPFVKPRFLDSNGEPLSGGLLYSYAAGTTTPLATYTDQSGGTPNTNPVILDSEGYGDIWLSSSAYKLVLTDSSGNVQWTEDNVSIINASSVDKSKIAANIAGIALAQNNTTNPGAIDVKFDGTSVSVNGSNQLTIPSNAIGSSQLQSGSVSLSKVASPLEVLIQNIRDLTCPGLYQSIPQFEWSSPSLFSNPTTLPSGEISSIKWCPNGEFLALASAASPYILIYQRSKNVLTKLSDPSTLPTGGANWVCWSPCGDFLAVAFAADNNSDPCFLVYQRKGNSFTNITTPFPTTSFGTVGSQISFSPNSDFFTLFYGIPSHGAGFYILERSGTTFTDITSSVNLADSGFFSWSGDSSLFAIENSSGNIDIYQRSDTTFTNVTTISSLSNIFLFAFSPDSNFFVVTLSDSPYIAIFSVSGTTFTQITNPTTLPAGQPTLLTWSKNSEYLAISHATSPFMTIYQNASGVFTKISDPSTLPITTVQDLDFSATKQFLAVAYSSTPYFQVYETSSTLPNNALIWTREGVNV